MASADGAFCAQGHFWALCEVAPQPEQMCCESCLGVVQPSSRCHAVHSCLPSFIHSALRMRSVKVLHCLSQVCMAMHSMVRCGLCPRQTVQHGRGADRAEHELCIPSYHPLLSLPLLVTNTLQALPCRSVVDRVT